MTGAKVWEGSINVDRDEIAPHAIWVGTDIDDGDGVDIVGDLQELWRNVDKKFDAVFSQATLEHIERPWVAVHSRCSMLRPGGVLYIQSHHTFPIHGYPSDYFRFSDEALKVMVRDSGLIVIESGYSHPCFIKPPEGMPAWNELAKSYLNVAVCAVKPHPDKE